MAKEEPVVFLRRVIRGLYKDALDRLGEKRHRSRRHTCLEHRFRALGLACFLSAPGVGCARRKALSPHLTRIGHGLALALEIASVDIAAETSAEDGKGRTRRTHYRTASVLRDRDAD